MNLSIGLSLTRPSNPLGAPAFSPASLFASGEEGAWYDPSDLSTVWQDAAGTTPATAGDPVGRIDDKSGNGNHATQSTPTARPTLSARVNLITYSEQLNNGDWLKYAVAVSADAGVAPDSTTTADLLYATSTGSLRSLYRGGLPSVSKRHRYYAKASGKDWFCILTETTAAGGVWFDVANGVLGTVSAGWTASIESAGNGWYVCTATSTSSFSQYTAIGPVDADNSTTVTASGTDGILVWGADVRTASTSSALPAYQQITDAATYDTVGFLYYLDFDGSDDWLRTTFSANQAQPNTIAAAFKFDQGSRNEFVVDGVSTDRNAIYKTTTDLQLFAGSSITDPSAAGTTELVALGHLNTTSSELRVDGSQVVTGDVGSNQWGGITLGADSSDTLWLDGRIYGFVGVNRTLTAGEIDDVESYLAAKSGVTL
jgi:hypothetical protein